MEIALDLEKDFVIEVARQLACTRETLNDRLMVELTVTKIISVTLIS